MFESRHRVVELLSPNRRDLRALGKRPTPHLPSVSRVGLVFCNLLKSNSAKNLPICRAAYAQLCFASCWRGRAAFRPTRVGRVSASLVVRHVSHALPSPPKAPTRRCLLVSASSPTSSTPFSSVDLREFSRLCVSTHAHDPYKTLGVITESNKRMRNFSDTALFVSSLLNRPNLPEALHKRCLRSVS